MYYMDEPTGWEHRKHGIGYDQYAHSAYANEMRRRMDYYSVNQVMQDASSFQNMRSITPRAWNNSLTGWGWDDIRAMLPDAIENVVIQPVVLPFVPTVIDNLAIVYAVPVKERVIHRKGSIDRKSTKLLNSIYDACENDNHADQLCKWTSLFSTSFQFITYDNEYKRLVKTNLPPYRVYVLPAPENPSDIQHPNCFVAIAQDNQGITSKKTDKITWQCWYGDYYWYEQSPGKEFRDNLLTVPGKNINPYRDKTGKTVKPILVTHDNKTSQIYDPGSDKLILMNQRLDRDMTAHAHTMEFQGFAVPVAKGVNPEEMIGQPYSPAGLRILPSPDSSLEFIHPVAPIGEFMGAVMRKARAFARFVGIDPELVDPDTKTVSGVARAQQRVSQAERREQQFPKWSKVEHEAYYLSSIVWNTHNTKRLPVAERYIKDEVRLDVIFGEFVPPVDPLADIMEKQRRISANLNTRAEVIAMERRIPLDAAKEVAIKIKEDNEEDGIGGDIMGDNTLGQPGNRPKMEEESEEVGTTANSGNVSLQG